MRCPIFLKFFEMHTDIREKGCTVNEVTALGVWFVPAKGQLREGGERPVRAVKKIVPPLFLILTVGGSLLAPWDA